MSSSVLLPILTGGGSATVITTGIGTLIVKILKRIATDVAKDVLSGVAKEEDVKAIASDVTDLKVKLASETGGNSHGLRQAVNELDAKVDGIVVDVATLKARAAA
jgi:outer membrane murein-binding lipoprotein Lpp